MPQNCSEDYFEPLLQQNGSKIVFIVLSSACAVIGTLASYGISWFVNHSSEAKPTLVNKLIVKACFTGFQYYLLVQVLWDPKQQSETSAINEGTWAHYLFSQNTRTRLYQSLTKVKTGIISKACLIKLKAPIINRLKHTLYNWVTKGSWKIQQKSYLWMR